VIKRICSLITAALLVSMLALGSVAAPAFAVNTCKDFEVNQSPPFGQQTCIKGSKQTTQHGKEGKVEECKRTGSDQTTTCRR